MHFQFLVFIFLNCEITAYKVLIFNPALGNSHSNFLGKIADILIDAGHDVTMLIPVHMNEKKDLVGSTKVQKVIKVSQNPRVLQMHKESGLEDLIRKQVWKLAPNTFTIPLSVIEFIAKTFAFTTQHVFAQTEITEKLHAEHFDLGITESFFVGGIAYLNHVGVKTIINADSMLCMHAMKAALGEPSAAAYYPDVFSQFPDRMEFLSRVQNLFRNVFGMYVASQYYHGEMAVLPEEYKGSRDGLELLASVAFNFVNANQYIDYARPTLPKTVFVGGMQVNTKKSGNAKLSKEWDEVLGKRKTNVLVSFGSNAYSSDMPDEFKSAFLKVFESMPETTFIWKYEEANATLADHLPNVKLTTWMPQNDILADDRLTLFITHGGLGSTTELAYQGKPAIVIPLMVDQPRNAHMLTRHGGALQLDKTDLNKPDLIRNAIQTVLNDPKYKENAEKLAQILDEQPFKPKDVVLKHCDFAVKFGPLETLNSEGRHLNILQFYSIDIALVAVSIVIVTASIVYSLTRIIFRSARQFLLVAFKIKLD